MPAKIGYYTKRNFRKSLRDGGDIKFKRGTNATFDVIDDRSVRPEEKQFIYNNVLKTTNPITGNTEQFGELKKFFRNPENDEAVRKFFKEKRPRVHSKKENLESFLNFTFDASKEEFKRAAKSEPRKNLVPTSVVGEIIRNRPGLDVNIESADDDFIREKLGFFPNVGTFTPRSLKRGGKLKTVYRKGGSMSRNFRTQIKGQGGLDLGNLLGKVGDFASDNADILTSVGSTISNISAAGQLETEQTPVLARSRRTPFKSTLNDTTRANQASYQALLDSLNQGGGNTNLGRSIGIAGVTKANTEAAIADTQARSQFNLSGDRLQAGIDVSNVRVQNQVNAANLRRRNRRLIEQTSARTAGTQDLLDVFENRDKQKQEATTLELILGQAGETGVEERLAEALGMTVEQLKQLILN